ncbi:MAG: hypothetical protein ACFE0R_02190 [Salinarimonas sp.]
MLYIFPAGTTATVITDYDRPYADPIAVRDGDVVVPDLARSTETDILGWTWCTGPDGRSGWTPTAWTSPVEDGRWRMLRDFSALEHTVRRGDRAALHLSESGFVWATVNGLAAWIPDAVLRLDAPNAAPRGQT